MINGLSFLGRSNGMINRKLLQMNLLQDGVSYKLGQKCDIIHFYVYGCSFCGFTDCPIENDLLSFRKTKEGLAK
jgi:hypothetical protein